MLGGGFVGEMCGDGGFDIGKNCYLGGFGFEVGEELVDVGEELWIEVGIEDFFWVEEFFVVVGEGGGVVGEVWFVVVGCLGE